MSLNDESYLDDLLRAVTAEDNAKQEQTPLEMLEGIEPSNDVLIENSDENLQKNVDDNGFSSDDLTQMLQDLEQIGVEPIVPMDRTANAEIENFMDDSEEPSVEEQEEYAVEEAEPQQKEMQAKSPNDYNLDDLLVSMGDDEELAEVNDLLQKDENHEVVEDDDILALLERASQAGEMEEELAKSLEDQEEDDEDSVVTDKNAKGKKKDRKSKNKKRKIFGRKVKENSIDIDLPDGSNLLDDSNLPLASNLSDGSNLSDDSNLSDASNLSDDSNLSDGSNLSGGSNLSDGSNLLDNSSLLDDLNLLEGSDRSDDSEISDISELLDIPEKIKPEKKMGFFKKLLAAFFETDDDLEIENESEDSKDNKEKASEATGDNLEVLKELEEEDKKGKKKGKKMGQKDDSEDEGEEKKGKKPKKIKVPKESIEPGAPEKKLSRKKIIIITMFNISILAAILITVMFVPRTILIIDANNAFENKEYKDTYRMLSGMKLGNDDGAIYKEAAVVLELQRKYEAFENYQILDMKTDALNALLQGIVRYDKLLPYAEELQITSELEPVYQQIIAALESTYGLSEEEAREIIAYDRVTYTNKIESMVNGTEFIDPNAPVEETVVLEDMLPEEEMMNQDNQSGGTADNTQPAGDSTQPTGDSGQVEGTIQPSGDDIQPSEDSTGDVAGTDAEQGAVQEPGNSGEVLYSGTIKDGKAILHK